MNKSLLSGLAVVGYCPIIHMALSLSCPLLWLYVPLAIIGFCGFMLCVIELLHYRFGHGQEDWHELSVPYTPTSARRVSPETSAPGGAVAELNAAQGPAL